jgi:hypothetical protein
MCLVCNVNNPLTQIPGNKYSGTLIVIFRLMRPRCLVGDYRRFGDGRSMFLRTLVTTYKTTRRQKPEDHDQTPPLPKEPHILKHNILR